MLNTDTVIITPELLGLISEIDEFKGAWRALGTLAPERLRALRHIATIEELRGRVINCIIRTLSRWHRVFPNSGCRASLPLTERQSGAQMGNV